MRKLKLLGVFLLLGIAVYVALSTPFIALKYRVYLLPIISSYTVGIITGILVFSLGRRGKKTAKGQVGVGLPYVILAVVVITAVFISTAVKTYTEVSNEPIITVKAKIVNLTTTSPYYCLVLNLENIHGKTASFYKLVFSNGTSFFYNNNTSIVENITGKTIGTLSLSKTTIMEGEAMVVEACLNEKLTEAYGGVIFDRATLTFRTRLGG